VLITIVSARFIAMMTVDARGRRIKVTRYWRN